ncbi:MAG: type IV pilus modification PilV family protein [Nitrospiraceae bacterium]
MTMNQGTKVVKSKLAQQAGFTLLEGMIAAAVLGIGLLGLAGMQGISLGKNVDSNELGRVTNVAADMLERIKFNRQNALSYNAINTTIGCAGIPTTQVMTRGDCTQWQTLLNNSGLANAQGLVQVVRLDSDPALNPITLNQFTVQVQINWTGSMRTETSITRAKTVIFGGVLAPE